jgi:hypothetical protein
LFSGALIEQTYPSGRKVKNVIDNNGDLSMVQSARCLDSTPGTNAACTAQAGLWNYAQNFTYNPAGAVDPAKSMVVPLTKEQFVEMAQKWKAKIPKDESNEAAPEKLLQP